MGWSLAYEAACFRGSGSDVTRGMAVSLGEGYTRGYLTVWIRLWLLVHSRARYRVVSVLAALVVRLMIPFLV